MAGEETHLRPVEDRTRTVVLTSTSDHPAGRRLRRVAPWRRLSTLSARVIVLVLTAIMLTSGLAFYGVAEQRHAEAAQVQAHALSIARVASSTQAGLFAGTKQLLAALGDMPAVLDGDRLACATRLAAVRKHYPLYANLGVIAPTGALICSAVPVGRAIDLSDRVYFARAVSTRALAVGNFQVGRVTGKATINVGLPVLDPRGRVKAVVFAALDLTGFDHLVPQAYLPPGASLTVLDQEGTIIARYPDPARWVGRRVRAGSIASTMLARGEGVAESRGVDGVRRLYGFTRLLGPDQKPAGYVGVGMPEAVAYAGVNRTFARNLAGLGLVSLLAIAAAWTGTKYYVLRPVKALARTAERLAGGDLNARTGLPREPGELGAFVSTFDAMAASLEERSAALLDAEAQYRALVEQSLTGIYLIAGDRFVYVNDAFAGIFGYRADEIIDRLGPLDLTFPDDRPLVGGNVRARLAGDVEILRYTFRGLHRDGSAVDIEAFGRRLQYRGQPAILGTLIDITERKRAADRIESQVQRLAALREIDMAITASLDLRVTLNVLLEKVTAQLTVDAADVLLLDPHTHILDYTAGRGFRTGALQHTRLRLGESYAGQAALDRRTIITPNLVEAPNGLVHAPLLAGEGFITYIATPLVAKGLVKGVLELFRRTPLTPDQEWLDSLDAFAGQAAIAIDNATLLGDLQRSNIDLAMAYETTLEGWSRALDLRDKETEGHSQRVTEITLRLARALGMGNADLEHVRRGALLHDIGKMGVPDSILLKPGPLTEEEWEIMRRHPVYAYELLQPVPYLRPAVDIPYCHHEKWDGTGYPRGLKGDQIPLAARIFAVADVWDALRSDRPYRPAWGDAQARAYIREQAGKHFDPRVVDAFLSLEREMSETG